MTLDDPAHSFAQLAASLLGDPDCGWSMGSFGVIAEFHHVEGDPLPGPARGLSQATSRGAIRLGRLENVRPVAYETLSPKPHRWTQSIALCLPADAAQMACRNVLTELGPDTEAVRAQDRAAILFDMGLAQPQVDFCIRTQDRDLIALLRASCGRSVFEHGNPAMPAILMAHPHRVALTRIGRVEVYQMIGGPDTGGTSPEGPHTHVLPKLLRTGRTHSANTPIPDGWVPCCGVHPKNPVIDRMGRDRDFDQHAFEAFQDHLSRWGRTRYMAQKTQAFAALAQGVPPEAYDEPASRLERVALRNAIRQTRRRSEGDRLAAEWARHFDKQDIDDEDVPDETPGHTDAERRAK